MESYPQSLLLIVEDLSSDQQLIRYALEELGFKGKLEFLPTGQALINQYLSPSSTNEPHFPDLILLDLNLDDMQGQQVLDRLKVDPRTSAIPVIIFSSMESSSAAENCYSLGAGGFVRKPTDFDELKRHLEGILTFWLQPSIKRRADSRRLRF